MSSQTYVVTGAASGIGRECVRMLLAEGHQVTGIDLDAAAVLAAFPGSGESLQVLAADVGDAAQCRSSIALAAERWGRIDGLLQFAGVWTGSAWHESEPAEWERVLRINVTGSFFMARAAAERMISRGRGAMVLTGSLSARIGGVAGGPAYVASKGAVIGLTRSLAKSLGPSGIRVNAVNPGVVETPMTSRWPSTLKEKTVELTPLGRLAAADDIASVACFLASDAARFVTGEVVEVNGGFYFG